jgi:hypothetical protein
MRFDDRTFTSSRQPQCCQSIFTRDRIRLLIQPGNASRNDAKTHGGLDMSCRMKKAGAIKHLSLRLGAHLPARVDFVLRSQTAQPSFAGATLKAVVARIHWISADK